MKIFIISYRNKLSELQIFINHIKYILEDVTYYKIYIIHQKDERPFNNGALRNIGFLIAKKEYPKIYQTIDFIFHDINFLIGRKNIITFNTKKSEVKHIYGNYKGETIEGIFVVKGADFEQVKGYPNFWGWGYEDAVLFNRFKKNKISIIRNNFSYRDKHVIGLNRSKLSPATNKLLNINNKLMYENMIKTKISINDGLFSIKNLNYTSKIISNNIIKWDITHFKCNLNVKGYMPRKLWMTSPSFVQWVKANLTFLNK